MAEVVAAPPAAPATRSWRWLAAPLLAFAHSLLGCGVYGAYASKVTIVRLHRFPKPVLPVAGGLLFAVLIGIWYSSALWLYRHDSTPAAASGPPGAAATIPAGASPTRG